MAMTRRSSTTALIVIAFSVVAFPSMVSGQETGGRLPGIVGDGAYWSTPEFDYQAWANDITFYIGDGLIFQYFQGAHDVVVADSLESFEQCRMSPNLGSYSSGYETLYMNEPGTYYFMCSFYCQDSNMKFQVAPFNQKQTSISMNSTGR